MDPMRRLPDSELEIMLIIWDTDNQLSTSDIMQKLKGKKSVQLVQNYLNRLESKMFIKCNKIGRLNHYTPLVEWKDYQKQETISFVEKIYHNSPTKLFATLLESNSITQDDIAAIKKLLEESE